MRRWGCTGNTRLPVMFGPILGYDGSVYTPIQAYTGGFSYSTDENWMLPFSPQITGGHIGKNILELRQLDSRLFGILKQLPLGLADSRLITSRQCKAQVYYDLI